MADAMIYLVEDDESIRELILYALHSSGFEGRGFSSAEELWPAIKAGTPNLVLLDIMLPGEEA